MATVAPSADKATELLQNLSLDASKTKNNDASDVTKKPTMQNGSVDGTKAANPPIQPYDRSLTPLIPDYIDPTLCYLPNGYAPHPYYYSGYDGSMNDWEHDFSRYVGPDGVDLSHGVYGDAYHHAYGYAPYGAYPPGSTMPTVGHDGQLYGPQQYQYPGSYYQPPMQTTSSALTPTHPPTTQAEVTTTTTTTPTTATATATLASDQPAVAVDGTRPNSNGTITNSNGRNENTQQKANPKNSTLSSNGTTYNRNAQPGNVHSNYQFPRYGSPGPWVDGSALPDWQHKPVTPNNVSTTVSHASNVSSARNQNVQTLPNPMALHPPGPPSGIGPAGPAFMSRMYPNNRIYGQYGTAFRSGHGFMSNGYGTNARGWVPAEKYRTRGRGNGFYGYGNENMEGLNELNRGPRSGRLKNTNQKVLGPNAVVTFKGQTLPLSPNNEDSANLVPDKEQYNKTDFSEKYSDAKFYIIKSYSEDDIHKSIKYNVWASTPNGNKKLDAGYQEAQEKSGGLPLFLFFSVNTSGQFVGVAEMVGNVDFNKTVDYWQQDKWNGCFPVKWHIVKDVPNSILKHITLENNDNKPVTNSRDTQEVKFEQGIQLLKLFKDHVSKTSILDDFGFYEGRQKAMQEKRAKQQFQKQVWDGKMAGSVVNADKDATTTFKAILQKPLEVSSALNKESEVVDGPKVVSKSLTGNHIYGNGISNGC
ncbi:hypothetical protein ZOSMA_39G00650 [Zostera marina]|uniref:YTH domain-containing family protein n=1 Tax=Zostera marina TaxID=29655 RepID=A0A0K9P6G7_ZOSMR|nr:hypothetical protein ZOSMA_39G00650 [Zostera marina]